MTTQKLFTIDGQHTSVTCTEHENDAGVTRLGSDRQSRPAPPLSNRDDTISEPSRRGHGDRRQPHHGQNRAEPCTRTSQFSVGAGV